MFVSPHISRRFSKQILVHVIKFYSVGPENPWIFTSGSRPREVWEPLAHLIRHRPFLSRVVVSNEMAYLWRKETCLHVLRMTGPCNFETEHGGLKMSNSLLFSFPPQKHVFHGGTSATLASRKLVSLLIKSEICQTQ